MANTVMKWRYDNGVSIGGSEVINILIYVLIIDGSPMEKVSCAAK